MHIITREYAVVVAKRTDCWMEEIGQILFHRIPNDPAFWAADPFPIEFDGVLYIFAEIFEYAKGKGSIGYTKLSDGIFSPWKIVIEEKYHLSFPNLLHTDTDLYMCPEAYQSGEIYLYKCIQFPDKWVKDKVLVSDGNYVDTIFHNQAGTFYGFTCKRDAQCPDNPDFKIFKLNENSSEFSSGKVDILDTCMTRPAGKIIKTSESEELMVSQIGRPLYGSGLVFKKFELNWPNYHETELFRILPHDINCDVRENYVGLHTFNLTKNYIVIDLIWNRFSLRERLYSLKRKLFKIRP